jgi:peptide-methionine (S)-S-oxide reductase
MGALEIRFDTERANAASRGVKHFISISILLVGLNFALSATAEENETAVAEHASVTFAGGCFWCMEAPFDHLEGVISTTSGYTGGSVVDPTYEQVSSGGTGHAEAVRVVYDPDKVEYRKLLDVFWRNVDPVDAGGQFCDRGSQYRSAIFYHDAEQRRLAEASKKELEESSRFDRPIATEIVEEKPFFAAEEYHQDYYQKNPLRYRYYRYGCGRDARLEKVWGSAPH